MRLRASALLALSALVACGAPSGAALAQELARDHNLNARMGRMELAAENVAPEFQGKWTANHRDWGGLVRIADTEITGTRTDKERSADKGPADVFVFVKVAWYRADQGELHGTIVRQRWSSKRGGWFLAGEDREGGDAGLLGDFPVAPAPAEGTPPPGKKSFATHTLSGDTTGAP